MRSKSPSLRAQLSRVPVNRFLGFRLVSRSRARVVISVPARACFAQEGGVVHGALLSALADTAAVYLVVPELGPHDRVAAIEFKINFLRSARPGRTPLRATARPLRRGRRVVVAEAEVHQGRTLVATGLFTYMVDAARIS